MAQAESASITSRRSFLAAAAVAGAIVASNVAAASAEPHPDAELIRLGDELSKLTQENYSECARMEPFWAGYRDRMDAWRAEHPTFKAGEDAAAHERAVIESGMRDAEKDNHPDCVIERYTPVADKIKAIPARTWAGVIVKAQLAKFAADDYWDKEEDGLDPGELAMRKLCDAVIAMAAQTAVQVAGMAS